MMALGLGMVSTAYAQSTPQKGDFSTEIGFTPFKSSGESFKLNDGMFKFRYFLSDKDALRLKVSLGINNTNNKSTSFKDANDKSNPYTIVSGSSEKKNKYGKFEFTLGYERHFNTNGRLDIYAGAELGYGSYSYSGEEKSSTVTTDYNNKGSIVETGYETSLTEYKNQNCDGTSSSHYFTGSIFTGLDFYVYKSLYLGAELGINLKSAKSPNAYINKNATARILNANGEETARTTVVYSGETGLTVTTTTIGSQTQENKRYDLVTTNEKTTTNLKIYVEPAIRLGWKF